MFAGYNPFMATLLQQHRERRQAMKAKRAAEKKVLQDVTTRVQNLQIALARHFERDANIRVYVNETQVNIDFLDGKADKIYLTCSRKHDKIKVDYLLRDVDPMNNRTVFAWFEAKYGLIAKDLSGKSRRNTKMNFMIPQDQLPKLIETIAFDFRVKYQD